MKILVTGGAGFIGSHLVDRLAAGGHAVRILDSLEEPTHPGRRAPEYLNPRAEFLLGDIRSTADLERAVDGVEVVFHLAATGGYTPDLARYFDVNSVGTARLMEVIRRTRPPVRRILVASSMAVYGEGLYSCPFHGPIRPGRRRDEDLARGRWEHACPECGEPLEPVPIPESAGAGPATAYSISKFDQERIVLSAAADLGVAAAAMRYFLTYGPRQSPANPYTGICAIFLSRLLKDLSPVLYEDGLQTRDILYVDDLVRAHLLLLEADLEFDVYNVGAGESVTVRDVATTLAAIVRKEISPEVPGAYRPGETRHITADITRIRRAGFAALTPPASGLAKAASWFLDNARLLGDFHEAQDRLRASNLVRYARRHPDL